MRVGVLTGGGDCPGLNAVIRAVVRAGEGAFGHTHVGLSHGWRGLLEGSTVPLDMDAVAGILPRGGTVLRSSRTNPFAREDGPQRCLETVRELGLDAIVAIGGEDTLGAARRLHDEHGLAVVGVPKTIDNDLSGTDVTFGFWTAVQIACDAIDRLHTTAESHDRVLVAEVMGRHAGWIALESARASGAQVVLLPEFPPDMEAVYRRIADRRRRGRGYTIVVAAEGVRLAQADGGAKDEFGHHQLAAAGVADELVRRIEAATGAETRALVLGHIQRGGTPTAYDRALASRLGAHAARMVAEGRVGRMAALHGERITDVPLSDAVDRLKTVPEDLYREALAVMAAR